MPRLPGPVLLILENALNRALADSRRAPELRARLAGRSAALKIVGPDLEFFLCPTPAQIVLRDKQDVPPDVSISGTPWALGRAGLQREGLPEGLRIEGDGALAQGFQQLLAEARLDWEAELARVLGDEPARLLGAGLRRGMDTLRDSGRRFAENLAEYLREETGDLPHRHKVDRFVREVDTLRDDVARAEARLNRLAQRARA